MTQLELTYSHLVKEATRPKKRSINYRVLHAALLVLLELLYIVQELSLSVDSTLRKNAQILMQNIFQHDLTRIIRIGLIYSSPGLLKDQLLETLVELQMVFFDMLDSFSKGKVLSIQTDKRYYYFEKLIEGKLFG